MRSKRGSRPGTPCPPRVSGSGIVSPTAPTEFDPETIRRAAGVTTLLHEACEPTDAERGHTSGDEAGTIAVEAGVSRLVLTHNHPLPGVPERTAAAAQARFAAAVSATDGAVLEL
jgi:ribonuclease BN (tRNA processing enzyme)